MKVNDLPKLFSGKKVKLGDFELEVKKLGTDDLPLLAKIVNAMEGNENEFTPEFAELLSQLTTKVLRNSIEDATDTDNLQLPIEHAMTVLEAVMDINKSAFDVKDEHKQKFLERMREKQNGLTAKTRG